MNGVQSHSNLISINTKKGSAENVNVDECTIDSGLQQSKEYIFVENDNA